MAIIKLIPNEHLSVLIQYVNSTDKDIVLIPQHSLNDLAKSVQAAIHNCVACGGQLEYDYGGEADVLLDIADSADHFALQEICEKYAAQDTLKEDVANEPTV